MRECRWRHLTLHSISGNCRGMSDEEGARNTILGLNRLKKIAEDQSLLRWQSAQSSEVRPVRLSHSRRQEASRAAPQCKRPSWSGVPEIRGHSACSGNGTAQPTFTCTNAFGDPTLACESGSSASYNGNSDVGWKLPPPGATKSQIDEKSCDQVLLKTLKVHNHSRRNRSREARSLNLPKSPFSGSYGRSLVR